MDIYARDNVDASVAQVALDVADYKTTAVNETNVHREYMVREAVQQYRDYYESDAEDMKSMASLSTLITSPTETVSVLWKSARISP